MVFIEIENGVNYVFIKIMNNEIYSCYNKKCLQLIFTNTTKLKTLILYLSVLNKNVSDNKYDFNYKLVFFQNESEILCWYNGIVQ